MCNHVGQNQQYLDSIKLDKYEVYMCKCGALLNYEAYLLEDKKTRDDNKIMTPKDFNNMIKAIRIAERKEIIAKIQKTLDL